MHSAVQSSVVGRAPLILLLLLICISPAILQAPGDSDEYCINRPFHPGFEERENPLMDSKNYPLLLSTTQSSGVWQSLDLDDNNDPQQQTKVSEIVSLVIDRDRSAAAFRLQILNTCIYKY